MTIIINIVNKVIIQEKNVTVNRGGRRIREINYHFISCHPERSEGSCARKDRFFAALKMLAIVNYEQKDNFNME